MSFQARFSKQSYLLLYMIQKNNLHRTQTVNLTPNQTYNVNPKH